MKMNYLEVVGTFSVFLMCLLLEREMLQTPGSILAGV